MNILISNDDGIHAEGINVLFETLSKEHDVYMIAPSENRSAISHGITMVKELRLEKHADKKWSCSGTPADCIIVGLKSGLLPVKIDAVVAGINGGANLGTDIVYSGTCGVSREAVLDGIPSVALSLDIREGENAYFKPLADFALKNLTKLLSLSYAGSKDDSTSYLKKTFCNVNARSFPSYKGAFYTDILSERKYNDCFEIIQHDGYMTTKFLDGSLLHKPQKGSDFAYCEEGYIAVSSILCEPKCFSCTNADCAKSVDGIEFSL